VRQPGAHVPLPSSLPDPAAPCGDDASALDRLPPGSSCQQRAGPPHLAGQAARSKSLRRAYSPACLLSAMGSTPIPRPLALLLLLPGLLPSQQPCAGGGGSPCSRHAGAHARRPPKAPVGPQPGRPALQATRESATRCQSGATERSRPSETMDPTATLLNRGVRHNIQRRTVQRDSTAHFLRGHPPAPTFASPGKPRRTSRSKDTIPRALPRAPKMLGHASGGTSGSELHAERAEGLQGPLHSALLAPEAESHESGVCPRPP